MNNQIMNKKWIEFSYEVGDYNGLFTRATGTAITPFGDFVYSQSFVSPMSEEMKSGFEADAESRIIKKITENLVPLSEIWMGPRPEKKPEICFEYLDLSAITPLHRGAGFASAETDFGSFCHSEYYYGELPIAADWKDKFECRAQRELLSFYAGKLNWRLQDLGTVEQLVFRKPKKQVAPICKIDAIAIAEGLMDAP